MTKSALSNKSGNPENLKKIIRPVEKLFNFCAHSWRGFAEGIVKV